MERKKTPQNALSKFGQTALQTLATGKTTMHSVNDFVNGTLLLVIVRE
jgi:hypothetical protein